MPRSSAAGRDLPQEAVGRLARMGALTAVGLALFVLEGFILPLGAMLPLPGFKIGLANLAVLIGLERDGLGAAAAVSLLRVMLAALLGGTLGAVSFWLSLGGAVLSLVVMGLTRLLPGVSIIGISTAGAVAHNLGQLGTLAMVMAGVGLFPLLPWLILAGIPSGLVTGFLARQILARIGQR